jgi:magnesium transporter
VRRGSFAKNSGADSCDPTKIFTPGLGKRGGDDIIGPMLEPARQNVDPLPLARKIRTALRRAWGRVHRSVKPIGTPAPEPHGENWLAGVPDVDQFDLPQSAEGWAPAVVTAIDYSIDRVETRRVDDIAGFLASHRPEWSVVRWINVAGINDMAVIRAIAVKYDLHPLAVEDVVQIPQRPKVEDYPGSTEHHARLFVIARMVAMVDGRLMSEQVSFFLGRKTLLTFQETSFCDVWNPIRQKIATGGSRLRQNDVSFLLYSLVDAIVDRCFPILEVYSDQLENLEDLVLAKPAQDTMQRIHAIKRELLLVRRAAWPMREAIHNLQRETHECMSDETRTYLRDVYDHTVQIIDLVETYREFANGLTETYMSALSIRMNEIMKVLTIMGTIFIPLTFLAGVYGMNVPLPGGDSRWAYPAFLLVCVTLACGMLLWFKRRGWV